MKTRQARFRGTVERHSDAVALLEKPGDMALVVRGVPRMLVLACPDGCGDVIPINLDRRADKAWHYYCRETGSSLYPSVWRDEGCQSHFILWNDIIYWSGLHGSDENTIASIDAVARELSHIEYKSFFAIASELDEIPWAIRTACDKLVRKQLAEEGVGRFRGHYRLLS